MSKSRQEDNTHLELCKSAFNINIYFVIYTQQKSEKTKHK